MNHTICTDCAIAHANADFTGMDADTEARIRKGMAATGYLCIDMDSYTDFSWSRCTACGTTLGGGRFAATAW